MMKKTAFIFTALIFSFGCARVSVQAPKDPIKVDISMRLDIYQHVQQDITQIEGLVSGEKDKPGDKRGSLEMFVSCAYAQEGLAPEVEQAALRRKERLQELHALEARGAVGENKSGMAQARGSLGSSEKQLLDWENGDRMIIYKSVAAKNNISIEEVQKLYAQRLQGDAPAGAPVELLNEASGAYEWKIK